MRLKFFTLFLLGISNVHAMPAEIVIIRHAEKPESGDILSVRGSERANALVNFLSTNPLINQNGPISAVYAASPPSAHGSIRSLQTVAPFAQKYNLEVHNKYDKDDIEDLVNKVTHKPEYEGHTVLICFEHKAIPEIAEGFGVKNPPDWDASVFDRAWIITFRSGTPVLKDIPQRLLPGDSAR